MITIHKSKLYQVYQDDPELTSILNYRHWSIRDVYEKYLKKEKIDNICQLINDFHEEEDFSYEKGLIFHLSIIHEYRVIVELLLNLGFDIYQLNRNSYFYVNSTKLTITYLSTVLLYSPIDFIEYMIDRGYDINHPKGDSIIKVIGHKPDEKFQYLLSILDFNQSSLDDIVTLVCNSDYQKIPMILEKSPWSLADISETINNNMINNNMRKYISHNFCSTMMNTCDACGLTIDYQKLINNTCNTDIIEHILKKGIYPSSDHLGKIIKLGKARMLSLLIKYGADLSVTRFEEEDEEKCDELIDNLITSFPITDRCLIKILLMTNSKKIFS